MQRGDQLYQQYLDDIRKSPDGREQLTLKLQKAFEHAGENWKENSDMNHLDNPYYCRGNVRKAMLAAGSPIVYDRLALMAVSVFHLSHWRTDVTVKYYMQ